MAGWFERNGMNGNTLTRVAELWADNEWNVTKGGGTMCNQRVEWTEEEDPDAGFGRKTIYGLHPRRMVGLFVVFPGDYVD